MDRAFLVTCHGWSASNWLAHALHQHPGIACTHSARNVIADDPHEYSGDRLRQKIREFHRRYGTRQSLPLDTLYDEIHRLGDGASLYGSVHLLRLRDLPTQVARHGAPLRQITTAQLVRHPIDLVWSGRGQLDQLFRFDLNELYWTLHKIMASAKEFVLDLAHEHDILIGEPQNLAWVGACAVLGSLRLDLDAQAAVEAMPWVDWVGEVKMEEVTRDRQVLAGLVDRLSGGRLAAPAHWLDQVFAVGEVNRHRIAGARLSPADRYASLAPWQREVLHHYLDLYEIVPAYTAKGYDFSFLGA